MALDANEYGILKKVRPQNLLAFFAIPCRAAVRPTEVDAADAAENSVDPTDARKLVRRHFEESVAKTDSESRDFTTGLGMSNRCARRST